MPWTKKELATLERMWAEGYSASQIAMEVTLKSRSAVLGMVHRRGLERGAGQRHPTPGPKKTAAPKKTPAARRPAAQVAPARSAPSLPAVRAPKTGPEERPVHYLQLVEAVSESDDPRGLPGAVLAHRGHAQCRFPIGEPEEAGFRFCSAAPQEGSVYCAEHHAIAYTPAPAPRKKKAQAGAGDRFIFGTRG